MPGSGTCFRTLYGLEKHLKDLLNRIPLVGGVASQLLEQIKDGMKAVFSGGMLFEEMGLRYFGPIDGHDIAGLRRSLTMLKEVKGPVLLHVLTNKGHGVPEARKDPVTFHTPPIIDAVGPERSILSLRKGGAKGYTDVVSSEILSIMRGNERSPSSLLPCAKATNSNGFETNSRNGSSM